MPTLDALQLNFAPLLPTLTMVLAAIVLMLVDIVGTDDRPGPRPLIPWLALAGVAVTIGVCAWLWGQPAQSFQGMATSDHFALGLNLIVLTATALAILLSIHYIPQITQQIGEYYTLLLLTASGMMMMATATDLIVVFLALEIFSLALYILSGLHRDNPRSTEASLKYFLLGAFASAFFAYGAALIYGAGGSTQYTVIADTLAAGGGNPGLLYPGIAMLIAGFAFKVSLVPFHMWTPDVYQGAPTPVTAFMSVGTKAAAFAAFMRVLLEAVPTQQPTWGWALAILAVITMTLGNLAALRQSSLKRMLAYSSIAHAGYILVGLAPGSSGGADAALFYLFTYAFMNIGAFAVVIALEKAQANDALQNRASGIADRWPLLALAMAIFMFSLSGMPPLAGFFGKFYVFKAAVDGGWTWLAVVGMLNSAIGLYYYLRVTVAMYFERADAESADRREPGILRLGVVIAAIFTVIIGIYPSLWTGLFQAGLGG
jgi:NADH-quinone oxidoreductase subunit N